MSNPVLNDKYFTGSTGVAPGPTGAPIPGAYQPYGADPGVYGSPVQTATMTMGGVASAAGVMLVFVLAGGWFGWTRITTSSRTDTFGNTIDTTQFPTAWVIGSVLVGFVLCLAVMFRPRLARILAVPYSIAEGIFLGVISHAYDLRTEGVALQAVIATAAVFVIMLAMYGLRILRVTPRLTKGIVAATLGVGAVYLVGFISSFFSDGFMRFMDSTGPLSIGISLLVVGIAAFNLLLDFDLIERGIARRAPKEMEWFAAFGLVVTLVWLYLELLRLLSKLQRR